jgi:hypothetical protein
MATLGNRLMTERRAADRFGIEREVRFKDLSKKSVNQSGSGKTINISSNGVLFATSTPLTTGTRLEVSIDWPVQLNSKCALKLVARGRIVRSEKDCAAMEIEQHEFRTTAASLGLSCPKRTTPNSTRQGTQ